MGEHAGFWHTPCPGRLLEQAREARMHEGITILLKVIGIVVLTVHDFVRYTIAGRQRPNRHQ